MIYRNKKRLQIINYIYEHLGTEDGLSKEIIGKLIYLSDKLFLLKYGCTITGDKFLAFERGTTCSESLALMDMDMKYVEEKDKQAVKTFKDIYDTNKRPHSQKVHTLFVKGNLPNNFSTISPKEREILDIIINRFGGLIAKELSNYTHQFNEWKVAQNNNCIRINMEDVFKDKTFLKDEYLSQHIDEETCKISHAIYNGEF